MSNCTSHFIQNEHITHSSVVTSQGSVFLSVANSCHVSLFTVHPPPPHTPEVFLEAQIQNITTSPMFMEKVSLEPSIMYNVTELNTVESGEEGYWLHPFFYVRPSVCLLWSLAKITDKELLKLLVLAYLFYYCCSRK